MPRNPSSLQKIGLFTGTFDPVHLGHVALAIAAQQAGSLDQVWFLVNPNPGHKHQVVDYADRWAMLELAIRDRPELVLYSGDYFREPHNIETFSAIMKLHPSASFVFLVGLDVLDHLPQWPQSDRILREAHFAVARRRGATRGQVDPRLRVTWFEFGEHAQASSKDIRDQLRAGMQPAELDPEVNKFIRKQHLYGI